MMRHLDTILAMAASVGFVLVARPASPRPIGVSIEPWHAPPRASPTCGSEIELVAALPDPSDVADAEGETVWLRNRGPTPIELGGFELVAGRSRRALDDWIIDGGKRVALTGTMLRPIRLRNIRGDVALIDACGVAQRLTWSDLEPGRLVALADEGPDPPWQELPRDPTSER